MDSYDFLLKFLIIGAAGTGKSCMLFRFMEQKFKYNATHTIGVEFSSKIIAVGPRRVKLQVWDTAGQERFRSVTRSYYRGAAGALVVFDITSRDSFLAVPNWLKDALDLASPNLAVVLVGHKADLGAQRAVSAAEAGEFARANGLAYMEASALSGEGVEEAFMCVARTILAKIEAGEIDPERTNSGIQYGSRPLSGRPLSLAGASTAAPASSSCSC